MKRTPKHAKYGQWYLVELASGRWTNVWYSFLDAALEDAFTAIFNEDQKWFDSQIKFARPDSYLKRSDALEAIIARLEKEQSNYPSMEQYLKKDLVKARNELRKAKLEP